MVEIFLFCQPVNKQRSFISVAKQGSKSVATKKGGKGKGGKGESSSYKRGEKGRVGKGRSYTSAIAIFTALTG